MPTSNIGTILSVIEVGCDALAGYTFVRVAQINGSTQFYYVQGEYIS